MISGWASPTRAAAPASGGPRLAASARAQFPDWRFSPNIGGHPAIYERENRALEQAGHVLAAMRALAPWDGRVLVDLGCGTGYWLSRYAREAAEVIGIEPDPTLRAAAVRRTDGLANIRVLAGSAERLPLPAACADVVHARFAYFLRPGGNPGLAEVLRVLRPGGSLVVVDNDYRWGEFARLLAAASAEPPERTAAATDTWWRERGASRQEVRSELRFASHAELASVLEIELPAPAARSWLARHPAATGLTYGYVLFAVRRAAALTAAAGPRLTLRQEAARGSG
jgi:SAM-dependent methyltransferase